MEQNSDSQPNHIFMEQYVYDEYDDEPDYVHDGADYEADLLPSLESLAQCVYPSFVQVISFISVYLLWNGIVAVTTQIANVPSYMRHLISIGCGIAVMHYTFGVAGGAHVLLNIFLVVFVFQLTCYLSMKNCGFVVAATCITTVILQEFLETDAKKWHQIRGSLLITTMKLISVALDVDANQAQHLDLRSKPSVLETFGYLLSPANCILGPWISFNDYMASFAPSRVKWTVKWVLWILLNITFAVVFLLCSNCLISSIIAPNSPKWILAYRDAMSFRFSHYFVSFLSQALLVLSSHSDSFENKRCTSSRWGYLLTNPLHIEWPRSLVHVVVVWNMSMHFWLRHYVFRVVRPFGTFTAIIATYAASALLHGLNFQLAAVLLSLGIFTFVEHQLRHKLATIFSACIAASACKEPCGHRNKWNDPYVFGCNIVFGALAMMHLAYLGLMFVGAGDLQEKGFSYLHTLSRWDSLGFLSHWVVACSYLFYRFI